jgi:hypothetical protein
MNQQQPGVATQKSTTRLRVKNQVMIDCMAKFYRINCFLRVAKYLQKEGQLAGKLAGLVFTPLRCHGQTTILAKCTG